MHSNSKALVVGTTADYIDWIRHKCPERAIFLTDPLIRQRAREPKPAPHEEILCDLADYSQVNEILKDHLQTWKFSLDGIISYDCESMELAAVLAENFSLSYPSVKAIQNCRDKYTSKSLWHQSGINCPRARPVTCARDAMDFLEEIDGPCVLKPARGSGGELQFRLENAQDCERHFHDIVNGLRNRPGNRLYASPPDEAPSILAEEYIPGEEFSCDFLMENNHVNVIRLSRKIPDKTRPFGTIQGYILPSPLPIEIDPAYFLWILREGAKTLGITRAICMLDFIINEHKIVLLEMTPRPGGDCIPLLLRQRYNMDIIQLSLDFAQHRPIRLDTPDNANPCIGLCLRAKQDGVLKSIDAAPLHQDPRVNGIHFIRTQGHVIEMPPADYDSWLLGHITFLPEKKADPETQCDEIIKQITIEVG